MTLPLTLNPGDRIQRYRLISPLGAGGMGEVYRARDESLGRDVALKILPPSLVQNEELVRRFVLEAKSASSLNHPNIITIYEIGVADTGTSRMHFISMEHVEGATLWNQIHREKAPLRTLLGWLAQCAEGLSKAHAAGIVHRDLKPGNIMVSRDGYAKVLDFGLAKLTEKHLSQRELTDATIDAPMTSAGVVLGTVGYMSPEQIQGKAVDHRSDMFSFGCILYEAATRRRPFTADTGVETMHKILHEKPTPVEELNPEAPAEVKRLIRRCLTKDPNQRLDSMKALALELHEIVAEYDTLSPTTGSVQVAATPASPKQRVTPILLGSAAILVALAIGLGLWPSRRNAQSDSNASFQSMQMTAATNRGDLVDAVLSSDGRYLAYSSGASENYGLWVRQLSTETEAQILTGQKMPLNALRFTPDGTYLFYETPDPTPSNAQVLYQISSLGGTPRKREIHAVSPVSFSPDGKRICFLRALAAGRKGTSLVLMDLESGQEQLLTEVRSPLFARLVAWSPDGERIATPEYFERSATGYPQSRIITFDVENAERQMVGDDLWNEIDSLVWTVENSGLLLTATDPDAPISSSQIWFLPFPGGGGRKVTNDLSTYLNVSVSSDGSTIGAICPSEISNLWTCDAFRKGSAHPVTFSSSPDGSISSYNSAPDGAILYLTSDQRTLHRIAANGTEDRVNLPSGVHSQAICGLADGRIIYSTFGEGLGGHLRMVDADGANARQLASLPGGEFVMDVSPDERTVLFRNRENRNEVWLVSIDGGSPIKIIDSAEGMGSISFSPDGTRILYSTRQDLDGVTQRVWKVVSARDGETLATLMLPSEPRDVEWSADGTTVTFPWDEKGAGVENIFRQRLDGGDPTIVTHFVDGKILDHAVPKDGRHILLARRTDHDNVWITATDGSNPVALTNFESGLVESVDWLPPDERRVLFNYAEESRDAVLIRNLQGSW